MASLTKIEGLGDVYAAKLRGAGVGSVEPLLEKGSTSSGRKQIIADTGLSGKVLLRCVNHADLFRIKGVAGEYAELLEAAGVDTVPELAQRNATNLCREMVEVNASKKLVRRIPAESQVTRWVQQAKKPPRVINY